MAYILSSQNVRIEQQSASIGARALAIIIDIIIMACAEYGIMAIISTAEFKRSAAVIFFSIVLLILPLTYPLLCETFMNGQTIGKRILHIRVVTLEGGGPKITSLLLRWLTLYIDLFGSMGIGELCVFFTKRQQRLGDLIAGTWVVKTQTYDTENLDLLDYPTPEKYTIKYPKAKNLNPSQALIIAEALEALEDSFEVHTAMYDLAKKVELIAGKSQEDSPEDYLYKVLYDYRFDK